jgi:signal transduction histidine kinase
VSVSVEAGPRVIVEDQGLGIPEAQHAAAFDRYWRADNRQGTGAGVGLALTRRIAQLHDGQILIEARPRGGTKMVLSLVRGENPRARSIANAEYKEFTTSFSQS